MVRIYVFVLVHVLLIESAFVIVDVIEEDALNEKYCIQVLSILIAKEDTEIDELEKELVSLQSELAWAKCEEWPHICCNALREKIESLQTSVRSLMSEDIAVHLLLKPAESLHDIMKALLSDFFQEKIMQVCVLNIVN